MSTGGTQRRSGQGGEFQATGIRAIAAAALVLMVVIGTAWLRPRLAPRPTPLAPGRSGVVLVLVSHWSISSVDSFPHIDALAAHGPIGIVPTRGGEANGDDTSAIQALLAGSRSPAPNSLTLRSAIDGIWKDDSPRSDVILHDACTAPPGSVLAVTIDAAVSPQELDDLAGSLTAPDGLPAGWSLLTVGVSPTTADAAKRVRAAPVLLWQRDDRYPAHTLLTSPSVRSQPGLAAATDVGATVAALLDLPADRRRIGDGRPMEVVALPASGAVSPAAYLAPHVQRWGLQAREQHLMPGLPWTIAVLLLLATFAPAEPARLALRAAVLTAPLAVIVMPSLIPAEYASGPAWMAYALAAVPTILVGILAARNTRHGDRILRCLAIAMALTIVVDTLLGGPLLSRTPLSYSVLEAARFYGIGNEISGLLLGSAIVAIGPDMPLAGSVLLGIALSIISAAPVFGADAGGFIATLIAFTTLVLVRKGQPANGRRTVISAAIATICILGIVAAFALWDAGRGAAHRTHVGEAVAAANAHGIGAIYTIAARKLAVNARLSVTSPWAALFVTEAALLAWLSRRKRTAPGQMLVPAPEITYALAAATVAIYALNDSGIVAAATCGLWAFALRSEVRA